MDFQGSLAWSNIDPNATRNLAEQIFADLENEREQLRNRVPAPRRFHSIYRFPDALSGIEEDIRQPNLASFGPYHKGKPHLRPFEEHKKNFRSDFFRKRIEENLQLDVIHQLIQLEDSIRQCYHEDPNIMSSRYFVKMILIDGSFIVELFLQYKENSEATWPWYNDLTVLRADLLKLENQLPFFVLENLYYWSALTGDQATEIIPFGTLALRFLNDDALGNNMNFQNGQQPKHLLDLLRLSLLPATPPRNNPNDFKPIQCAELLCSAGISLKRKSANSFLEIDFQTLQIPPFALNISHIAIDGIPKTILVNCVALEQCPHNTSKHFTAYIRFLNCLVRQPEDVKFLRIANIITCIQQDDQYVIEMLNKVGAKVHFNAKDSYLWKQYQEIDSFYHSFSAWIWRNLNRYNTISLLLTFLAAIIALCAWLFRWLSPKKPSGS